MSAASRAKGLRGERDCADVFERAGWTTRGLESSGDWLTFREPYPHADDRGVLSLHIECKRAERLRIPEWVAQAESEAPAGIPAVVVYRRSREPWRVVLTLHDFLRLIG